MSNLLSPEVVKEYKEKLCAHRYMAKNNVEQILITTKAKANEKKENLNKYLEYALSKIGTTCIPLLSSVLSGHHIYLDAAIDSELTNIGQLSCQSCKNKTRSKNNKTESKDGYAIVFECGKQIQKIDPNNIAYSEYDELKKSASPWLCTLDEIKALSKGGTIGQKTLDTRIFRFLAETCLD